MSSRLYSKRCPYKLNDGRGRKKRPKTFKSKESAALYAEKNNVKNYELVNLRFSEEKPKYRLVVK